MIAWFARNGVAANLLMGVIIVGGLVSISNMRMQMFPDFDLDTITVHVPYPGSTPAETEEGICVLVEEAIQDLDGIKQMTSQAYEGAGSVIVEVERGQDVDRLTADIKTRVDAITNFPEESEEPIVEKLILVQDVIHITVYGQADPRTLKRLGERVRDGLLDSPKITQVVVSGLPDYEISIEVSESTLRRYGLTLDDVARAVRASSLDLPAGTIRTRGGEVLVRTTGKAYTGDAFAAIVLRTDTDGRRLTLGDVATVRDGFEETTVRSIYENKPAVSLTVRATRNQNVLEVVDATKAFVQDIRGDLPPGIEIDTWGDISFYLRGRLNMLLENGAVGLLLVFGALTLFLRPSLAIWVALGIPVCFMGTFALMGFANISINIISLFGFIMVLGIVVDDAIVVGESVFTHYQKYGSGVESAIRGSHAVALPVTFAVLTTIAAFIPILFLPGFQGKLFQPIPYVVIASLLFSLVESKLILPYHLTLCKVGDHNRTRLNLLQRVQRSISDGLERFIEKVYQPFLGVALRRRYVTLAVFVSLFVIVLSLLVTGWMRFVFVPGVPSDYISAQLTMAEGTPIEQTEATLERMIAALNVAIDEVKEREGQDPIEHWAYVLGSHGFRQGPRNTGGSNAASNYGDIMIEMQKSENRVISAPEFAKRWRELIGELPGVKEMSFRSRAAGGAGSPVDLRIVGLDFDAMTAVAQAVKTQLATYQGIYDIADSFSGAKREIQLTIKPQGEILGLTQADLARQVRQAFYGAEAQRIQRGRDEIKVMVRYPEDERRSIGNLENMRIRTADGREVPFYEVAEATMGRGFNTIKRVDRKRAINVTAEVDKETVDMTAVNRDLSENFMPELMRQYPNVSWSFEGEARDQRESMQSLKIGAIGVLFVIYALMAVPFKSYTQPLIVMSVIPFGLIGAIFGHLLFGKDMSFLSIMGCLALSGVLVNDSLVMVDYVNQQVRSGVDHLEAVWSAGAARFRAIMLTSLTTFLGLFPILLERSLQAQFLIPMALSLAFGIVFGTLITLLLVPSVYLILEDVKALASRMWRALG